METGRGSYELRALRGAGVMVTGTAAWVATLALAKFGPGRLWDAGLSAISWLAVALNVAAGIALILGYVRYLHGLDDLQRKVNTDALAITFGVAWVAGFVLVVIDQTGLVRHIDWSIAVVALAAVYVLSIAAGTLRYR